jgi:hypothetical protein
MAQMRYESRETGNGVVLQLSTTRAISALVALLGFEAGLVTFTVLAHQLQAGLYVLCLVSAPVIGIPTWWLARRLVTRNPMVIADEEGITDNASLLPLGLVRWSEIRDIHLRGGRLLPLAHVVLVDPPRVFARLPRWRQWLCRFGTVFFPRGFAIPLGLVGSRGKDNLLAYMRRRCRQEGPSTTR